MTDYNEKSVEELRELAAERELEGRSKLTTKDKLVAALEESDSTQGQDEPRGASWGTLGPEQEGHDSPASDPQDSAVVSELSDEGETALIELGDDSESAQLADLALDASGPLHLQSPSERVMVGAVNEAQAKEQTKKIGDVPEDFVGDFREDGSPLGVEPRRGSGPNGEVLAQDVIDFPPPLPAEEDINPEQVRDERLGGGTYAQTRAAQEAFPEEGPTIAQPRLYEQRGQLYTDGLSGQADHNLVMAYRVPDVRGGIFSTRTGDELSPQELERRAIEKDRTGDEE